MRQLSPDSLAHSGSRERHFWVGYIAGILAGVFITIIMLGGGA